MFDIKCLSLNETNSNDLSTTSGIEENFFATTLNYVLESERNMIEVNKQLYRSLLESGSDVVAINEGFSDFTSKVVSIISKFLSFIKNLWDRFVRAINGAIRSDKYLIKHADLLGKFDDSCEFDINDYTYTFKDNIPIIDAQANFQEGFIELDSGTWDDNKTNREKSDAAKNNYETFKNKLDGDYYDSLRASVIGRTGEKISKEDYKDSLFKVFRNNEDTKEDITIKSDNVNTAYLFVKDYKTALKSVEDTKKQIEIQYTNIKNYVSSLLKVDKKDGGNKVSVNFDNKVSGANNVAAYSVDSETLNYLNLFVKAKTDQISEMSAIHSISFSAKLDAFKECYKSSRSVCYKAIAQVQKIKRGEI